MRIAVIGAGVAGLVAAHRLAAAGHAVDVYERWPGLGGQAATLDVGGGAPARALLPPPVHHRPPHRGAVRRARARGRARVARVDHGDARARPPVAVHHARRPAALRPDVAARARADGRRRRRAAALREQGRALRAVTAQAWIERWMGRAAWREVWGPLLRGKFGPRAGDIAMVWLWSKLRLRRGEDASDERLGYPRSSWEPLLEGLRASIESRGGRVLIDRPAARIAPAGDGWEVRAGRAGLVPLRARPARLRPRRRARALRPRAGDRAERRLHRSSSRPACCRSAYRARLDATEYCAALCLLLEVDRRITPYYWTNVAEPGVPFVGLIEHTNFVEPERYDGRRFLYVANYLPHGDPLLGARRRGAARALRGGPAPRQPGLGARLGARPVALHRAGRAADRDRRLPRADPAAARPARPACCSPTRRRSIRRTAGPTTRCASATRRRGPCSPSAERRADPLRQLAHVACDQRRADRAADRPRRVGLAADHREAVGPRVVDRP